MLYLFYMSDKHYKQNMTNMQNMQIMQNIQNMQNMQNMTDLLIRPITRKIVLIHGHGLQRNYGLCVIINYFFF
jgi:uncharacterized iron-regulated protein